MKTVRFRLSRVVVALVLACLVAVVVLKSAVDSRETKPNIRTPLQAGPYENGVHPQTLAPRQRPFPDRKQDSNSVKVWTEPDQDKQQPVGPPNAPAPSNEVAAEIPRPPSSGRVNGVEQRPNGVLQVVQTDEGIVGGLNIQTGQRLRGENYPLLKAGKFVPPLRVVHFDLKGAAPRVPYFQEIFPLLQKLGANSVLLEWEDMFPYSGQLASAAATNHYSVEDIRAIINYAKQSNLEVIPLVQTFGHLEWVLKYPQFQHLRESERYPQVICLSNEGAIALVKEMIDQVLALHPDIRYFHMGADEAFQIGMCQKCQKNIQELGGSREKHMLRHIVTIAGYVKEKYGKRVLMWHDMLNNVDPAMMREHKLGDLVEPVVWAYAENLNDYLMPDMWQRFASVFPHVWGASAFKGADGPSRFYSNVPHYLQNHISWVTQMSNYWRQFSGEFRGLMVTGWQRFDHFAILCELFPVGIPSLAVNLQVVINANYDRSTLKGASKLLDCSGTLDIDSMGVAGYCKFPGFKAYQYIQQLRVTMNTIDQQLFDDYQLRGWMSEFNRQHNYSSAWYLDQVQDKINMYYNDFTNLLKNIRDALNEVYFPDTADEFIYEYAYPHLKKMEDMLEACRRIGKIQTFPKRPFPILLLSNATRRAAPDIRQNQLIGGSAH